MISLSVNPFELNQASGGWIQNDDFNIWEGQNYPQSNGAGISLYIVYQANYGNIKQV